MSVLTIIGSGQGDIINPDIFGTGFTEYNVYANDGDDVVTVTSSVPANIFGGAGDDTLTGGSGNDTLNGGSGQNVLNGGGGDDFITGGKQADTFSGGDGDDLINSGNGNDTVTGGKGDDILNGAGGDDHLDGGKGNDTINGGSGDDYIFGRKGHNLLDGGAGNDTVNTGDHTSIARGGAGDDLIQARLKKGADHTLSGGDGEDVFEFQFQSAKKSADVTITDFELGLDEFIVGGMIGEEWVDAYLAGEVTGSLDGILTEVDGNAVLNIGFNDSVMFEGVSAEDFAGHYLSEGVLVVG